MDFSQTNCSLFYKFYLHVLAKYYGIGNAKLSYKDKLLSYLNIYNRYLEVSEVVESAPTTEFVGTIVSNYSVVPTISPDLFFQNDQAAYDGGVAIGNLYYLSEDNTYGLPYGTPKKLVEEVS